MTNFSVDDLCCQVYNITKENPDFKKDLLTVNKQNRHEVLSFCLYVMEKNKFALTKDNLQHIERSVHHEAIAGINNKKDLSYFIRRNWKIKDK